MSAMAFSFLIDIFENGSICRIQHARAIVIVRVCDNDFIFMYTINIHLKINESYLPISSINLDLLCKK